MFSNIIGVVSGLDSSSKLSTRNSEEHHTAKMTYPY